MLFLGNASGHDFQFHIASWLDAAGQWREGIVYPRWAEWANWGFGEPRFIFYPPGSWMAGAALGTVLPWRVVPGVFIWLVLVSAGMAMWTLAREWMPARYATMAAVLFALNPYHLLIVYYRSDFAELMAGAFVPLIVWGALRMARGEWRSVPVLGAAFAGMWLSDAPAAVIATYALALILLVACVAHRSPAPIVPGAAAMAGGFGLAAFYILPAAREQRWVQITQVVADNLGPARNFLFTHSNDPDFVAFNWKVSYVAVSVMLVTIAAAVLAARRRRDFLELYWVMAALGLVSIVLMLPFTNFLWRLLPELRFVQFPWRWLEVLALSFAFFVAAAISRARRVGTSWAAGIAVFLAICAGATAMIRTAWWDTGDVPSMVAAIHSGGGYRGTDEYDPLGCDRYELPGDPDDDERVEGVSATPALPIEKFDPDTGDLMPASDVKFEIEKWSAEHREFSAQSAAPVTLAVRLLSYPSWAVRVDGNTIQPGAVHDNGQVLVALGEGTHRVEIQFRRTRDRTAGAAISVVSVLVMLGLAIGKKRPMS
jgi:6-pyruvoyl-tetrahydropterin synthase related domain